MCFEKSGLKGTWPAGDNIAMPSYINLFLKIFLSKVDKFY